MSNCPGCDNSSTTYTRCNPPQSSNCTFYQGESLTCANDATFKVCKGDNLTEIQKVIFDKICSLSGSLNIESIEFPCSLQDAWEKQDPTILNLLQYVVNIQCEQNSLIASLQGQLSTLNPEVEICLSCCGDNCGSTKLLLSQALTKIVDCLCVTKAEATNALAIANNAFSQSTTALNNYNNLVLENCKLKEQVFQIYQKLILPTPSGGGGAESFSLTNTCSNPPQIS